MRGLPLFVLALFGYIVYFLWHKTALQLLCPNCHSADSRIDQKEPTGMSVTEYQSHDAFTGHTVVVNCYDVTYRCNRCQSKWTKSITETK